MAKTKKKLVYIPSCHVDYEGSDYLGVHPSLKAAMDRLYKKCVEGRDRSLGDGYRPPCYHDAHTIAAWEIGAEFAAEVYEVLWSSENKEFTPVEASDSEI